MESLQNTICGAAQALTRQEGQHRIIYTTTAAAAFIALLAYSRHCYVEWYDLGESGIQRTPVGWFINVAAHLVARRDHRSVPAPYERMVKGRKSGQVYDKMAIVLSARDEKRYDACARDETFLLSKFTTPVLSSISESGARTQGTEPHLPERGPHRPTVPTTVAPQRQTTETASAATVARQIAYLEALAAANPRLFGMRPSRLESPKFSALWLLGETNSKKDAGEETDGEREQEEEGERGTGVDVARAKWLPIAAAGEIAHVHPEGSTHVCLSLPDAAEVVRRGWGERHKLSGVAGVLPWGYVLLYAPRGGDHDDADDEARDWEVWKAIVLAGARVIAKSAGFEGEVVEIP